MKNTKQKQEDEIKRYWFVEFTSKDGETQKFYVKAKDQFQAYKVGQEWADMMEVIPSLRGFKLRY